MAVFSTWILFVGFLAPGIPAASATPSPAQWPGGGRDSLMIPDELWERLSVSVHHAGCSLGYTEEEMANYGRDLFGMRTVSNLFRDVRAIPRANGVRARGFIADAGDPSLLVERAYALTDVAAGRMLPLPDSTAWGAAWLPDGTAPAAALDAILAYGEPASRLRGSGGVLSCADREAWNRLPEPIQRLVVRVFVGAAEAAPWLRAAFDDALFHELFAACGAEKSNAIDSLYAVVAAPWTEERLGQAATLKRRALEAPGKVDREYLGFGSVIFFAHVHRALREYRTALRDGLVSAADLRGCTLPTVFGPVLILGTQADEVREPAFLVFDLGGNDHYEGRHAVPRAPDSPIAALLDLGGDDVYEGGEEPVAMACGLFGVGAIFDLAGSDRYRVAESGLGAGWYGTGLLLDWEGDDTYVIDSHCGEGAAHVGVGLLVDLAGDDQYTCGYESQGLGATYAAGILVDVQGSDLYVARDDGNVSELYLGQSVSMSQGVGYGRRADLGDGHSLAGGFGVLIDGAGNDRYHATAWSQGAGYWWAVGILEDLGGDDTYRNGKYSLGAAAHFGIGCQVDLSGNDRYNVGNQAAVNQFQGHARDGSIGISWDGDGDDEYLFKSHCAGSGDLNSIGVFWDRRGDDRYHVSYEPPPEANGWSDTPPMGTTTVYAAFHSFRDDLASVGVFLDTGGRDSYRWTNGPAANNRDWLSHRGPNAWGLGWDIDWFRSAGVSALPAGRR